MTFTHLVIDPGHGGLSPQGRYVTPGKRYGHVQADGSVRWHYEGAWNRVGAAFLANLALAAGVRVFLTTQPLRVPLLAPVETAYGHVDTGWEDVWLKDRVALANRVHKEAKAIGGSALFVSVHSDAADVPSESGSGHAARGVSVYTSTGKTSSDAVARALVDAYTAANVLPLRGPKEAAFYVLEKTTCPAVLLERGFHTNPSDSAFLCSLAGQEALAEAEWSALAPLFGSVALDPEIRPC